MGCRPFGESCRRNLLAGHSASSILCGVDRIWPQPGQVDHPQAPGGWWKPTPTGGAAPPPIRLSPTFHTTHHRSPDRKRGKPQWGIGHDQVVPNAALMIKRFRCRHRAHTRAPSHETCTAISSWTARRIHRRELWRWFELSPTGLWNFSVAPSAERQRPDKACSLRRR